MTQQLPSWETIARNAIEALDAARSNLSTARDWLKSDWRPGTVLTDEQAVARSSAFRAIGEAKNLIDGMKQDLGA